MPLQEQKDIKKYMLPLHAQANDFIINNFPNEEIASLYPLLNLQQKGLSKQAFEYACKGYRRLLKKQIISKEGYLTICDFSQSSKQKRLYMIDMVNNEVVIEYLCSAWP